MLRFAYETYRGNGVDSATVDTNGTAGNQLTFDDPANSNYKWAQVALWALVETEDNRKKNPHWYKSIDVQWAIDYYKRSATNWDSGPNLKLPLGQKLVGADEVAGLQNLAKTISDDLADIRGIQSLRKTSRFRAKRR